MNLPLRRFRLSPPRTAATPPGEPSSRSWRELFRIWRDPRRLFGHNAGLKVIAFVLAVFVWFTINASERDAERHLEMPVVLRRVERGLVVTNPPGKPVTVRVRGPRTLVDGIDERATRLNVDLTGFGPGEHRIDLSGQTMLKPELVGRVKAVSVDPPRLKINIERLARRTLPVHADLTAITLAFGYTLAETHVDPAEVEVTGPASLLDDMKEVLTEGIDLRHNPTASSQHRVSLARAGDFVNFAPDEVNVTIRLEESMSVRDFQRVPVKVLNAEGAQLQASTIDLRVRGPQRVLHNFKLPDDAAHVDAAGLAPGSHSVDVHVDLPPELEIVRTVPDKLLVRIGGGGGH